MKLKGNCSGSRTVLLSTQLQNDSQGPSVRQLVGPPGDNSRWCVQTHASLLPF